MLGDGPRLVRLDGADEVPVQGQVGQFGLLAEGLLQVVFAEVAKAGGVRLAHRGGGLGLAHGEQADRGRIAPRSLRCLTDARGNLCNILCYRGHYLRPMEVRSASARRPRNRRPRWPSSCSSVEVPRLAQDTTRVLEAPWLIRCFPCPRRRLWRHSTCLLVIGESHGYYRAARLQCQTGRFGPAPLRRPATHDPGGWRCTPDQPATAGTQAGACADLRHHERQAAQGLRGIPRDRLLLRGAGRRAFPGQRLQPEPWRRRGIPDHSLQGTDHGGAWHGRSVQTCFRRPARVGTGHRADRFGQVHHPGGDARLPEQHQVPPHPHHRGPDRIRPRIEEVPGQPARGASRHPRLQRSAALGAAGGPGHHPGRRDARPGNHPPGPDRGGDRPPGIRHPAHHLGGEDHRPGGRRVPGRGKGHGSLDALRVAAIGDLADPDQEDRRRPGGGPRDHDRHPGDPQPDPRGQGRADVFGDPDRRLAGHADPRHVPQGPGRQGPDQPRERPREGEDPGKLLILAPIRRASPESRNCV
uniref:ORF 5 n=1 Tax=Pseudomonas aeruginosa TaxID=287 RepID=Q8VVL8_PSEAI|nr:ORF 5 [Pseudomonas aeruginosa PAO1]